MKKIKNSLVGYILILLAIVVLVVVIKYLVIPPSPKVKPSLTEKSVELRLLKGFSEYKERKPKTQKNIDIVTRIANEYRGTHTYSSHDLFVCGDMAIDVWNQIKTQGINATIAVGNVDIPADSQITTRDINHAWVLAEVGPFDWIAVETTTGRIYYETEKPAYYWGFVFNNPAEFKKYLELTKEYNRQLEIVNRLNPNDPFYHREYLKLRDISNQIEGLLY